MPVRPSSGESRDQAQIGQQRNQIQSLRPDRQSLSPLAAKIHHIDLRDRAGRQDDWQYRQTVAEYFAILREWDLKLSRTEF
jgi:hypothetical protein